MTFCCRPSPNCLRCRQRHLKCDRVRPACSQCKRAQEECAGYREELSLLFRDENERIIRRSRAAQERSRTKAQAVVPRAQASHTKPSNTRLPLLNTEGHVVLNLNQPMSMVPLDIDNHGLQFFFQHFSNRPLADRNLSHERQHNLFRELATETSFRNAVVSVGLAALSNVNRDCALLNLARQRYGAALRTVRSVVETSHRGDIGIILKTIAMLGIFEMVDAKPETLTSCKIHLTGIAAILKRYPFPQGIEFDTQAELWFYLAVIVNYFEVGGLFPAELDSWPTQRMALLTGETQPAFELIEVLIKFVRLCASLPHHRETRADEEVLREALKFEIELQAWRDRLPGKWSFIVKESVDMAGTFYGKYHVYQDAWALRVMNHYQLGRLLVNEVIVAYVSQLRVPTADWIEQKKRSLVMINQMATDICVGIATQGVFAEPCALSHGSIPLPVMKGIFMTIYPLTMAASATGVSDQLRNWVTNTLQMMGEFTGIRQAFDAILRIQLAIGNQGQLHLFPCRSREVTQRDRQDRCCGIIQPVACDVISRS
ncbi:hypothetical protein BJX76DRAFT_150375 [Aspergillus varians]